LGIEFPEDMQGKPLTGVMKDDSPVRETALFGYFGAAVNITDGEYVYMRSAANKGNCQEYEYTLMPTHMKGLFTPEELSDIQLAEPFSFTKGCRVMKLESKPSMANLMRFDTKLYRVEDGTGEEVEVYDTETELRLANAMALMMKENDAPVEQFERMGLPIEGEYTLDMLNAQREFKKRSEVIEGLEMYDYEAGAYAQLGFVQLILPEPLCEGFFEGLKQALGLSGAKQISKKFIQEFSESYPFPDQLKDGFIPFLKNAGRTS
jgi:hypothetical protein